MNSEFSYEIGETFATDCIPLYATIYHVSNYNIPLNLEFEIPIQSVLCNNLYNKFALSNNRVTITL